MKTFRALWGEGYVKAGSAIITMADMSEENGWDDYNIGRLEKAYVGEIVDCTDISGVLFVQRIE